MFYVYILKSERDGKLYYGFTSDLKARVKEHNDGKVKSTKYRIPLKLIYYEAYTDQEIAASREKQIKNSGKIRMNLRKRLNISDKPMINKLKVTG